MKIVDFKKIIATCVQNFDRCRQLVELMKIHAYLRSMPFLDLGPRIFTYALLRDQWAIFNQILCVIF